MKTKEVRARLDPAAHKALVEMSKRENLSMNWLINKAVKEMVKKEQIN